MTFGNFMATDSESCGRRPQSEKLVRLLIAELDLKGQRSSSSETGAREESRGGSMVGHRIRTWNPSASGPLPNVEVLTAPARGSSVRVARRQPRYWLLA